MRGQEPPSSCPLQWSVVGFPRRIVPFRGRRCEGAGIKGRAPITGPLLTPLAGRIGRTRISCPVRRVLRCGANGKGPKNKRNEKEQEVGHAQGLLSLWRVALIGQMASPSPSGRVELIISW
jgi:hypothetical protein